MNKDKDITLIVGDSWGCGEWGQAENIRQTIKTTHGGLAQFLQESDINAINFSKPGGTNLESSSRLENFLIESNGFRSCVNKIFVFQTEWQRDCYSTGTQFFQECQQLDFDYDKIKSAIISRFYYQLSSISQDTNIPIYIIGGCSDTVWLDRFEYEYPGVQIVCQSWVNLCLENNHRISDPVFSNWSPSTEQLVKFYKQHMNQDSLNKLFDDIDLAEIRRKKWNELYQKGFFCEDRVHPNRHAFKFLFDFLDNNQVL